MAPHWIASIPQHLRSLVATPLRARRTGERGWREETREGRAALRWEGFARAAGALPRRLFPRWLLLVLLAAVAATAAMGAAGYVLSVTAARVPFLAEPPARTGSAEAAAKKFASRIEALRPRGLYIVVDTALNRLYLKDGPQTLREAVVSCGSGGVLPNPKGGKDWVFDTPRGERAVERKVKNPLWIKPDWAFVEEGKTIPPKNDAERAEEGVLGDYALGIGGGYFLHGTLYTRMLGRNVTHGCVRIGDADLAELYKRVPIGAKVYIF